ncbi:putative homeobox protein YOX1 [Elsinoe fawcettii]|nr:putative homeobox protein YOX1 [Elsinoe fawcettii]
MPALDERHHNENRAARHNDSPSSSHTNIAFIVHSSDSLTNNLPPNVDNKPLARQKRRRTSPEDQLILEAEYDKNPKPDKAARMDIVRRVALGEKEVQIWFQNRRQASRRKSRPLEPHEIAQYQSMRSSQGGGPLSSEQSKILLGRDEERGSIGDSARPTSFMSTPNREGSVSGRVDGSASSLESSATRYQSFEKTSQTPLSSQETNYPSSGYLADRRSGFFRSSQGTVEDSPSLPPVQVSSADAPPRPRALERKPSNVRLSLTADGAAKIVMKNDSSPSPPRKRPSPMPSAMDPPSIERTENASLAGDARDSTPSISRPLLTRKASGRSRDSRAWEFWADKDARSQLEEKAHEETSGSAADAIGRLRSTSGRNILGALTGKRSFMHGENPASKRSKRAPLLQRSQSLQNKQSPGLLGRSKSGTSPRKFKKAQSGLGIQMITTDSDKENWSPERQFRGYDGAESPVDSETTQGSRRRSTVTPGKLLHRALDGIEEHATVSSDADEDDEIAHFMGGRERKSNSVSEEEELDCVQGLLSLSQGNWK